MRALYAQPQSGDSFYGACAQVYVHAGSAAIPIGGAHTAIEKAFTRIGCTAYLRLARLLLEPEQRKQLAEALFHVRAQTGEAAQAQPGVHQLMRQYAPRQEPRQPKQHEDRCHLPQPDH